MKKGLDKNKINYLKKILNLQIKPPKKVKLRSLRKKNINKNNHKVKKNKYKISRITLTIV